MTPLVSNPATPTTNPDHSTRPRAAAAVGAPLAAALAWVVATHVAGVDLQSPAMGSGRHPSTLTAVTVVIAALTASLLGWAVLALLEKTVRHPRAAWTWLATIVFLVSLGAPLSGSGIDRGSRLTLVLLHASVAAVLIPLLRRTARPQR
jgi:hypothetical protein